MSRRIPTLLLAFLLPGCVLDRTGQSATERYRREIAMHGARLSSLEQQVDDLDARVAQIEELNRARGQEEILKMETLDQVRREVARLRGEVEVLRHDADQATGRVDALEEDAQLRLAWLEARAAQLEESLGLEPPPPPVPGEAEAAAGTGAEEGALPGETGEEGAEDGGDAGASVPEAAGPDELIALAERHLAEGRPRAAIAVIDRFLEQYPDHERVPEALYRRAEAFFNQGAYAAAVLRFQEVIDRDKRSPWAAWAMLRQGECFDEQGQPDNARLFYEDVIRIWPKSRAAREAREKLGR